MRLVLAASIFIALVSATLASAGLSYDERFVHSGDEYSIHTEAHRARMVKRAELLGDPLFVQFMQLHDLSKTNNDPAFRARYGLSHFEEHISDILNNLYGENLWALDAKDPVKIKAMQVISAINKADSMIAHRFFESHPGFVKQNGQLTLKAQRYLRWEKILDGVDTRMDPVRRQELGIPAERTVKELFASSPVADQRLAAKLEATYPEKSGLDYFTYLRRHLARVCTREGLLQALEERFNR
jgi:hypothetical protein